MRAKLLPFWRREAIERVRPPLAKVNRLKLFRYWRWLYECSREEMKRNLPQPIWWYILPQIGISIWWFLLDGWFSKLCGGVILSVVVQVITSSLRIRYPTRAQMGQKIEAFLRDYDIDGNPAQCATCGYCLDGINEGRLTRCPECGRVQPN